MSARADPARPAQANAARWPLARGARHAARLRELSVSIEEQKDTESERAGGDAEGQARGDAAAQGAAQERAEGAGEATSGGSLQATGDGNAAPGGQEPDPAGEAPAETPGRSAARDAKEGAVRTTAGARLAAAKAAKAAAKAARRARERQAAGLPPGITGGGAPPRTAEEALAATPIGEVALKASAWAKSNRTMAIGVGAAFLVVLAAWGGWRWWNAREAAAAGALLAEAVDIAQASIRSVPEDDSQAAQERSGAGSRPTFASAQERARAALEAYRRVVSEHPGSLAARWARLAQARAHVELGEIDEARQAYEMALREAGSDPLIAWRALEGIGFTYEAEGQWQRALERYQELRSIDDGAYAIAADYHAARMRIAMGERVEAAGALRALVERIREESASSEPAFPYVLAQAEVRLRELDPGSAGSDGAPPAVVGPGSGSGGLEGVPPEVLEQLRRQLREAAPRAEERGATASGGSGE